MHDFFKKGQGATPFKKHKTSTLSIDGGKPFAQFLNVIAYTDNSLMIKSGCYFSISVK